MSVERHKSTKEYFAVTRFSEAFPFRMFNMFFGQARCLVP